MAHLYAIKATVGGRRAWSVPVVLYLYQVSLVLCPRAHGLPKPPCGSSLQWEGLSHQPWDTSLPLEPPFRAGHLTAGPALINQGLSLLVRPLWLPVETALDWKSNGDSESLGQMSPQDIPILPPPCPHMDVPQYLPESPGGQAPLCLALNSEQASWGTREGGHLSALCPLPLC